MPVTAKLSRRFYEALGDEVANELVDWFNAVDLTYRGDLRELNELNFARFDAKLEQRIAQLDAKLEQRTAQLEAKLEQRLARFEAKVERRFAEVETTFEQRFAQLDTKFTTALAATRTDLIKWSFAFWIGTVVTIFLARLV